MMLAGKDQFHQELVNAYKKKKIFIENDSVGVKL